jgi:epoxide hydrolase-like predicted phosphatase
MTIRALIVDVGGVLTSPVSESFAAFCTSEGIDLADLRAAVGELLGVHDDDHPVARLEMGLMEVAPFDMWLAGELNRALGTSIAPDGVGRRLVSNVQLEERMFEVVRRARAGGMRTGLLSNSWGNTDYGPLVDFFDGVVISGAEGMRKPDARIYRLAAERVGAEPPECVFVDDVTRNVDGAVAAGMHAIHHTDPDVTIPELERLLGLELR